VEGSCEQSNEPSGSIKCWGIHTKQRSLVYVNKENCLQNFGFESLKEETSERIMRRWKVSIKTDFKGNIIWVYWINLIQDSD
jgi:hypothetical protein